MSVTGIRVGFATVLATAAIAAVGVAPAAGATAGDFDNNGVEDLAVGVPGEDVGPPFGR